MDYLSNFAETISELLEDNKITVEQLAQNTGIDLSEIYRYLRKEYLPTLANIIKIADKYNYSIDYILGLTAVSGSLPFKQTPPFAQRFKQLLEERGFTRYRLSKESGIAINRLDDWYNGKFTPSLDKAISLAKFFDCSVDYLLGRES